MQQPPVRANWLLLLEMRQERMLRVHLVCLLAVTVGAMGLMMPVRLGSA